MGILLSSILYSCANSTKDELSEAVASLNMLENSDAVYYVKDELQSIRSLIEKSHSQIELKENKSAASTINHALSQLKNISREYQKRKQDARVSSKNKLQNIEARLASYATELKAFPSETYIDQNRHDRIRYNLHLAKKQIEVLQQYHANGQYQEISHRKSKTDDLLIQIDSIFNEYEEQRQKSIEEKPEPTNFTSTEEQYSEIETINVTPGND